MFGQNCDVFPEEEFLKLPRDSYIVVDVRSPMEFAAKHLGIAYNLPYSQLLTSSCELPKDKKIFCYCNYGNRGGQSVKFLKSQGYQAFLLSGMELFSKDFIRKCSN
ncbi:MAG: rhodanese-like domain-containing protein [Brevinema sp.]